MSQTDMHGRRQDIQDIGMNMVKATVENPRDSVEKLYPRRVLRMLTLPSGRVKAPDGLS